MTNAGTQNSPHKAAAVSFLNMVIAGNIQEAFEKYVSKGMRHHNIWFKGDSASLEKAMLESHLQFPNKIIDIKHVVEEGNMVAVHAHVRFKTEDSGWALVHFFLFEGDLIIEMWDMGQEIPENSPNENGMF